MRFALIAAAVLFATPVLAQTTAPTPAKAEDAAKKEKDDPNRIVCKREHVVGSNRPQKVCMTAAERERLKDQSDRMTDNGRRNGSSADNLGGAPST